MPPLRRPLKNIPIDLPRRGRLIVPQPLLRKLNVRLIKENCLRLQRDTRKDEKSHEGDRDSDNAVYDEKPPPAAETTDAVEIRVRCCLEIAAEHGP
jgi:hypothetical protein